MRSWLRHSRKNMAGRGEDLLDSDLLDPARPNLAAVGVQQRAVPWHPRISTGTSPRGDSASNRLGHASPRRSDILTIRGATAGSAPSSRLRTIGRISRDGRDQQSSRSATSVRERRPTDLPNIYSGRRAEYTGGRHADCPVRGGPHPCARRLQRPLALGAGRLPSACHPGRPSLAWRRRSWGSVCGVLSAVVAAGCPWRGGRPGSGRRPGACRGCGRRGFARS